MKWFLLLPINISFTLLAYLVAPILPLFANEEGWLPRWLWWFQTPDNPLDGDEGFIKEHTPYKGSVGKGKRYINRMYWLWRNPAYAFDWTVLAFTPDDSTEISIKGTRPLGGDLSKNGWYLATCKNKEGIKAWQLYITYHWNSTHSTKINCGWKLWSAPRVCQFVFSPGFWKTI